MKRRLNRKKPLVWAIFAFWAILLTSLQVSALGLGEIKVFSALNQPLEAEITLNNVRPGEMDDLIIGLASSEAFNRAGVERIFLLSKLKFKASVKSDGTNVINVSSVDIIREPFLNFLVNIEWPRGNLIREYTVLLDPPSFSRPSSTVSAPVLSPIEDIPLVARDDSSGDVLPITRDEVEPLPELSEPEPVPEPLSEPESIPLPEEAAVLPPLPDLEASNTPASQELVEAVEEPVEVASDLPPLPVDTEETTFSLSDNSELPDIDLAFDDTIEYDELKTNRLVDEFQNEDKQLIDRPFAEEQIAEPAPVIDEPAESTDSLTVNKGDTLWELASKTKSADVGINQAMISILRANPEAFIDNNINNLKTGVVLRIPDRSDMLAISAQSALAQAREQNALWREYRQRLSGAPVVDSEEPADNVIVNDTSSDTADESAQQELSILAPGAEDTAGDRVTGVQEGNADGVIDENNLMLAKESIAAVQLEKADLQERLDIKVDELEQTNTLIQSKNEQLALLQARLQEINNAEENVIPDEVTTPAISPDAEVEQNIETDETSVTEADTALEEALASQNPAINLESGTAIEAQPELDATSAELSDSETAANEEIQDNADALQTPQVEEATIELPPAKKDKYAYLYEFLPPPLNNIMAGLVDSYGPLAALAIPVLLLLGLAYIISKRLRGSSATDQPVTVDEDNEPSLEDFESTVILNQEVVEEKPSLMDKIKGLFKRDDKKQDDVAIDETQESDDVDEDITDDDMTGEYEGDLPETTGAFEPAVDEAAATVEQSAVEEDLSDKTSQFLAVDTNSEEFAAVEPESDDTTAEADVYLAYGLFDQAEDLLKDALASNADKPEYNAKLLETYFASGKNSEFEALAKSFKETQAQSNPVLWTKVVAMGQELLPGNDLFAGESSGLKAADFVPSKPVATDIDVGDANNDSEPDFDIGEATSSGADIDISEPMLAVTDTVDNFDETIIAPNTDIEGLDLAADLPDDEIDIDAAEESIDLSDDIEVSLDEDELSDTLSGLDDNNLDSTDLDLGAELDAVSEDISADLDLGAELDTDIDLGLDTEADLDLDADADIALGDDFDADIEDLLNMDSDSEDVSVNVDDTELDVDEIAEDAGEETIISDDLTEIDFGESEDIAAVDSSDDNDLLEVDGDIADIAVDDEVETKLDLARAYMDMGDNEGAKSSLEEVIEEGSDTQKQEAQNLLQKIA